MWSWLELVLALWLLNTAAEATLERMQAQRSTDALILEAIQNH